MKKERKGPGGRPPYDFVLLFKILVLARLFNLSDDQTEYQINDRMSFMRFLGLGLGDRVPVAKTIWLFRDTLTKANVIEDLFTEFKGSAVMFSLIQTALENGLEPWSYLTWLMQTADVQENVESLLPWNAPQECRAK